MNEKEIQEDVLRKVKNLESSWGRMEMKKKTENRFYGIGEFERKIGTNKSERELLIEKSKAKKESEINTAKKITKPLDLYSKSSTFKKGKAFKGISFKI